MQCPSYLYVTHNCEIICFYTGNYVYERPRGQRVHTTQTSGSTDLYNYDFTLVNTENILFPMMAKID